MRIANRKEDNTKVMGLVAGVVVVFGLVVWRVMSALGGSPAPAGPTEVALGGGTPPAVAAATSDVPSGADIIPIVYPPGSTPNPFHKDTDGGFVVKNVGAPDLIAPIRRPKGSDGNGPVLPPANPTIDVVSSEPITILGVVAGMRPVAVIRVGSQDFVVNRGEKFGHGLRLKEVTTTQVVIEEGKELHYLRVVPKPPAPTPPPGTLPSASAPPAGTTNKLVGSI